MANGPEAKAAEEINGCTDRGCARAPSCIRDKGCKRLHADIGIIARANAAHFLPLLRDLLRVVEAHCPNNQLMLKERAREEIMRLEAAAKC